MKKKMMGFALLLMLSFSLCVPSFGAGDPAALAETDMEMRYVIDTYDLLSFDEWAALEEQAADISEEYGCGVYIVTVDDYEDYGDGSAYDVAMQIYHSDTGFGVGDGRDGVMLLLSVNSREYALFVYGERAEQAFNDFGQERLEDAFLDDFGNDNWSGGFSGYLSACEQYLAGAREGEPAQGNPAGRIVIVVLISCAVALVVCLVLNAGMKSVHQKNEAREYVAAGGLHLTRQVDRHTHTTETRRKIESSSANSRSGGGDGGRSGKF